MPKIRFYKDPDDKVSYQLDWSDWLDGDTISASAWTLDSGITNEGDSNTTTTTTIQVSGGTADTAYRLSNQITTVTSGDLKTYAFDIRVQE